MEEAFRLDEFNGKNIWQDAIKLEMKNSRVDFRLCEKGEKSPVGHTKISCHLIFDFKIDMTRKAWYVVGGRIADVTMYTTYSSVAIRVTVHIGFFLADLKNLDVLASDIQNYFLGTPTKENIPLYAWDDWKADKYKVFIVVR